MPRASADSRRSIRSCFSGSLRQLLQPLGSPQFESIIALSISEFMWLIYDAHCTEFVHLTPFRCDIDFLKRSGEGLDFRP